MIFSEALLRCSITKSVDADSEQTLRSKVLIFAPPAFCASPKRIGRSAAELRVGVDAPSAVTRTQAASDKFSSHQHRAVRRATQLIRYAYH